MDKYGSYSNVYLIKKFFSTLSGGLDSWCEDVLVVDSADEALDLINQMNAGNDAKNYPFYEYAFQAVPFKHRN